MVCRINGASLPVLFDTDAVVLGGSFAGIAGAVRLAKAGKKVALVEPRTYLGRELTATLRPWLELPAGTKAEELPEAVAYALANGAAESTATTLQDGYAPLHPDRLKRSLEDLLMLHGVELLYASLPVGFIQEKGKLAGVIVANKSGRQAIRCGTVLDATETALTALLSGEAVGGDRTDALFYRTLEFIGVEDEPAAASQIVDVPVEIGVAGSRIRLRQGCRGAGHVLVEFGLQADGRNTLESNQKREAEARHLGIRLAVHLIGNEAAFRKATLAVTSHELLGPYPIGAGFPATSLLSAALGEFELEQAAIPVPGVWSLHKAAWLKGYAMLHDPVQAAATGERAAEALLQCGVTSPGASAVAASTTADRASAEHAAQPERAGGQANTELEAAIPSLVSTGSVMQAEPVEVPVLAEADVLVAGGGSSGASAAIAAGREGMQTLLVDMNPGLGGTGTYGGVDSYWFGRRLGFAARVEEAVLDVQSSLKYKGHKWNIEAKMYALLREAESAGVRLAFNVITFGALKSGNRVCGALIATRYGVFAAPAKTVIDATGDGDIAAFAGAEYVYGSAKDHTVMWYSLAQFQAPGQTKNNFTSMVDVSNTLDYTRAIVTGRRRGVDCHDHGIYIATRESRHVMGDVVMNLSDQLLHRRWPDVVNVHFSNHDVKGVSGADWVNVGFIPPNLEIEIPYRMLLPRGLEGILVAGKALSATHDALPAIRMQSDLENLGATAAWAAAIAVRSGTDPRRIDLGALQRRLVDEGLLSENVLTRRLAPIVRSDAELEQLAEKIETEPLYEYSNMRMNEIYRDPIPFVEISSAGPRMIPVLERALSNADGVKAVRLAQALCMLGSRSGVPVLVDAIMAELSGDELPKRTAPIMYVQLPPDHGAMADAAYLLYSLAQAADVRSVPVWQRVADLLAPTEDDFRDSMLGLYYYIDAVCQGAERLGDRAALPALKKIHSVPLLHGLVCTSGPQPDYFLERRAMLELAIGRALARCGDKSGYEILIAYLGDGRSLLVQHAQLELERLSGGLRFGRNAEQWRQWLNDAEPFRTTQPFTLQLDRTEDCETILRMEV